MADAVIAPLVERLVDFVVQQIRGEVDLVRGVEKELLNLSNELKTIRNVLDDAEKRGFQDQSIGGWLKRLEYASQEMDDVLDEWEYAALKLRVERSAASSQQKVWSWIPSPSSCLPFNKVSRRHHVAKKTKEVKEKLDLIIKEKDRYNFVMSQPTNHVGGHGRVPSTSFVKVDDIYGREREREILLRKLVGDEGASQGHSGIRIMSLVGSGGIGKTTLAQLLYNDSRVVNHYPLRIWICVSDPFNQFGIAKEIVQKVHGSCPDTNQLDSLLEHLKYSIEGKKFFLVLDDVWTEDYSMWDPLKICLGYGGEGSKILVTTRKEKVAKVMGTTESDMHRIGVLSNDECWLILSRIAFSQMSEKECEKFKEVGKEIADKCKGLPLAAKALGSLLRFKYTLEEWKKVLDNEIWEFKEVEVELFPHLVLSHNELSPALKQCFSYLSFFSKDETLDVRNITMYWLALGYLGGDDCAGELELKGYEYFDNLAMRSLLQDFEMDSSHGGHPLLLGGKMHDIVHDFAQSLRKDVVVESTCQVCSPSLISTVKKYRTLLLEDDYPTYICDCLKSSRVLVLGLNKMPNGVEKLIHLRFLRLIGTHENMSAEELKKIFKLYKLKVLIICLSNLEQIPREIGNLVQLRHLYLIGNMLLKQLPETIGDLHELRSLDVSGCASLRGLPQEIHKLTNLKHLTVDDDTPVPWEAVGQLTSLQLLDTQFKGKLKYLKRLNQLNKTLSLVVQTLSGSVVDDAMEAELNKKEFLQKLKLKFDVGQSENIDDDTVWVDVLAALKPHQNLGYLTIGGYGGPKFPDWITSPLNQIRKLSLKYFNHPMWQFPTLGKLPCLERLKVYEMAGLEFVVGREFLGIGMMTAKDVGSPSNVIGFPKLEELVFWVCPLWKEWEDITAEEEHSTTISLFPCLRLLRLYECNQLKALPHRLWRKVITSSKNLQVRISKSGDVGNDYKMNILDGLNPGEGFTSDVR